MTDQPFKASNGLWITPRHDHVFWHSGQSRSKVTAALREFFQHQRDQQLGRVRWPENPDYVIYRVPVGDGEGGRCVRVADEQTGRSWLMWERWPSKHRNTSDVAALWYFTEGPGKKPERPWEQAQAGEVWRLTVDGKGGNYLAGESVAGTLYFYGQTSSPDADDPYITAGRKLLNADGSHADE